MDDSLPEYWSSNGNYGVRIEPQALESVRAFCRVSGRIETGGILVGHYSKDRRLATVTAASAPSPDTRSGGFWLVRGIKGLHSWLERLWKEDAGYYVGEWHFHPFAEPIPSKQDLLQMKQIAKASHYQCSEPILFIFGGDPSGTGSIRLEVHTRSGEQHVLSPRDVPALQRTGGVVPKLEDRASQK